MDTQNKDWHPIAEKLQPLFGPGYQANDAARIRHLASGKVSYGRTHDHSTMGVGTGAAVHSTNFFVPCGIPTSASEICVVANGIASPGEPVNVQACTIHWPIYDERIYSMLIGSLSDGPLWAWGPHGPVSVDPMDTKAAVQVKAARKSIVKGLDVLHDLGQKLHVARGKVAGAQPLAADDEGGEVGEKNQARVQYDKGTALQLLDRISDSLDVADVAIGEARNFLEEFAPSLLDGDVRKARLVKQFYQALANALVIKGEAKLKLNRIDDAIQSYTEAIEICREHKIHRVKLKAMKDRGIAYLTRNGKDDMGAASKDFRKIIEGTQCQDKCKSPCKRHIHLLARATAFIGLGRVAKLEGKYKGAELKFKDACKCIMNSKHRRAFATALIGLAEAQELRTWHDSEHCVKKMERIIVCRHNFTQAILLGRKIGYGFAIFRGQAGLRRLKSADLKCRIDCPHTSRKRAGEVNNCFPRAPKPNLGDSYYVETEPTLIMKRHVERMFGSETTVGFPDKGNDIAAYYHSFLPTYNTRTWMVSMMCDIRGYTSIMSQASPEDQFYLLDQFLKRATQIIQRHGGGVDKYMGDAVLGFFLPTTLSSIPSDEDCRKNTVLAAFKAALEIVNDPELKSLFKQFDNTVGLSKDNKNKLGMGIGIALGLAKFGEIGPSCHREYTAIGRPVNFAARLQGGGKGTWAGRMF